MNKYYSPNTVISMYLCKCFWDESGVISTIDSVDPTNKPDGAILPGPPKV